MIPSSLSPRKILLVRHGRTDWNAEHRFQGRSDVPLNAEGLIQAEKTAKRLAACALDAVYTSPLSRALRTAEAVAAPHEKLPVVLNGLTEVHFGSWEGCLIKTIREREPDSFRRWLDNPFIHAPEGAELWDSILSRAEGTAAAILDSPHRSIAVVAHGGTLRALLVALLGFAPRLAWNVRLSNCSLSGIEVRDGQTYLAFANDDLHLRYENAALPVW
ncbi:MAG: histidine phosphatase family protein [Synergistaceae bacterium]|jgi:alpha-ribazole phosphatase/probable phosphoglycerate mutase|nr:histidine phosphatase family protein [Synergistaceae bacterium]